MTIKELNWDQFADFVSRKDVKCSNYDVYQVSVTRDHSQLTVLLNYSDDDMKTFAQQVVPVKDVKGRLSFVLTDKEGRKFELGFDITRKAEMKDLEVTQ